MNEEDTFDFRCPHCNALQKAARAWIGEVGECTECTGLIELIDPAAHGDPARGQTTDDLTPRPPATKPSNFERLFSRVAAEHYKKNFANDAVRIREHLGALSAEAQYTQRYLHKRGGDFALKIERLWTGLENRYAEQVTETIPVSEFASVTGVGAATLDRLRNIGIRNAADFKIKRAEAARLEHVQLAALHNISVYCTRREQEAKAHFYPVFTNRGADASETKLLRLLIKQDRTARALDAIGGLVNEITKVAQIWPPYSTFQKLRGTFAPRDQTELTQNYRGVLKMMHILHDRAKSEPVSKELTQDEFIFALGILERKYPRPNQPDPAYGPEADRGETEPIPTWQYGEDAPSPLPGFSGLHKTKSKNRVRSPRRGSGAGVIAGSPFSGKQVSELLKQPRSRELIDEIDQQPLDLDGMRDIYLRAYQIFAAKFILSRKRVVIGDEMGLGKTIQALAVLCHLEKNHDQAQPFTALVICPASITQNWVNEIEKFTSFFPIKLQGQGRHRIARDWIKRGGIAIVSYESLKGIDCDTLDPVLCVVDEAHYIKNPKALRSENTTRILRRSKYAVSMTGTPIENHLGEFLNIFEATNERIGLELKAWAGDYRSPDAFVERIQSIYLRRNKQDVLAELPQLNVIHEYVKLSPKELNAHVRDIEDVGTHFMTVRTNLLDPDICGESKMRRVLELVQEYQENQRNLLIFSFFIPPLEWLQWQLNTPYIIRGGISSEQRQKTIDDFSKPLQNGEPGRVMCLQVKSGGVGLNIQAASAVILLEPQFNPAVEVQAISRVHRMGQRNSVDVHRMVSEGTIETILLARLNQKQEIMDLYAGESFLKNLSPDAVNTSIHNPGAKEADILSLGRKQLIESGGIYGDKTPREEVL